MIARFARAVLIVTATLGALCASATLLCLVFDARVLVVTSGSMAPAIDVGSAVVVREAPVEEIEVGEVVSVHGAGGDRVLHRVIATDTAAAQRAGERSLTLQGDANETPDPAPYQVSRVDRTVIAVPLLGYLLAALASPLGLLLLIAVIATAALLARGTAVRREPAARHRARGGRRPGARLRTAAVVVAFATLLTGWLGPRLDVAAAAFTDQVVGTTGSLTTTTVLPPDSLSCSGGGLLATSITISWPHKDLGYNYQVLVRDAANAVRATYTVTGAGALGSTLSQSIPGGLLGSLGLGTYYSTVEVRSQLKANASWQSATMKTWQYREVVIVAGLSIYCS